MPSPSPSSSLSRFSKKKENEEVKEVLTSEERQELGRLLDKLLGSSTPKQTSANAKSTSIDDTFYLLEPARLTDFGRASGRPRMPTPHDDHDHMHASDEHQFHNPFGGNGASQFFFSSMSGGPFGDGRGNYENHANEDEDVQCRQM